MFFRTFGCSEYSLGPDRSERRILLAERSFVTRSFTQRMSQESLPCGACRGGLKCTAHLYVCIKCATDWTSISCQEYACKREDMIRCDFLCLGCTRELKDEWRNFIRQYYTNRGEYKHFVMREYYVCLEADKNYFVRRK